MKDAFYTQIWPRSFFITILIDNLVALQPLSAYRTIRGTFPNDLIRPLPIPMLSMFMPHESKMDTHKTHAACSAQQTMPRISWF
jgi:hypothetical protein